MLKHETIRSGIGEKATSKKTTPYIVFVVIYQCNNFVPNIE